jgi:hypothetical protein
MVCVNVSWISVSIGLGLLLSPAAWAGKEVKVQVKSYIARMAGPGEPNGQPPSEATKKALGFDGLGQTRTDAYLFMLLTDKLFSEKPSDGEKTSGQFRLWSQLVGDVTCEMNKVKSATFKPVEAAFGKERPLGNEGPLELESVGEVERKVSSTLTDGKVAFSYRVRGRPHNSSFAAFTAVRPRSCTYIWHDVAGVVTCQGGVPSTNVSLTASAFPSHSVWVNGKSHSGLMQGPFENLWKCDPTDRTRVK